MTTLGIFRDDFYNAINVLTNAQYNAISIASGTITASIMSGAVENYISQSGATALTTDTAANIIANIQTCLSKQIGTAAAYLSEPPGVPNLVNLTYYLSIRNTNGGTLTLTGGTGVTITGTATLATTVMRTYLVTITSATTVGLQDLGGAATT